MKDDQPLRYRCIALLSKLTIGGCYVTPPSWWTVHKRWLISSLCLSTSICSVHHCYLCLPRLHENHPFNWEQVVELVRCKPVKCWWWSYEYMKIVYVNCGVNERWSQPRSQGSLLPALRSVGRVGENPGNEVGMIIAVSYIHNFIIILSRVYNEPIQRPAPSWLVSLISRALHRHRTSRVRIPHKTELFSGFLCATAKVAYITAMIILHLILHSAVHIYDFHTFITSVISELFILKRRCQYSG